MTHKKFVQIFLIAVLAIVLITIIASYIYIGMIKARDVDQSDFTSPLDIVEDASAQKMRIIQALDASTSTAPQEKVQAIVDSLNTDTVAADEAEMQDILDNLSNDT